MDKAGAEYRIKDVDYRLKCDTGEYVEINGENIPIYEVEEPEALCQWKQRLEADGGTYDGAIYKRIVTPYDADEIYRFAQRFFGEKTAFRVPDRLDRESEIYLPGALSSIVCGKMDEADAEYRFEAIGIDIFRGRIETPEALLQWKQRYEADGGAEYDPMFYERIVTPYDAEEIYRFAKKFIIPNSDPKYELWLNGRRMSFEHYSSAEDIKDVEVFVWECLEIDFFNEVLSGKRVCTFDRPVLLLCYSDDADNEPTVTDNINDTEQLKLVVENAEKNSECQKIEIWGGEQYSDLIYEGRPDVKRAVEDVCDSAVNIWPLLKE